MRTNWRGRGALAVGCSIFLTVACSGGGDDSSDSTSPPEELTPVEFAPEDEDFYEAPDPVPPGAHGDLIRFQPLATPPDDSQWYRVMYLSETLAGDPTVVTGIVAVPQGEPPSGGWRVLTHGHGGFGIADECAPSISLDGDRRTAPELLVLGQQLPASDYILVSSDYEGMGGPGPHPFLVGESEGRSVLDIALAARQLPDLEVSHEVAIAGYSQGGHSALWAQQIAPEWTPELSIIGTMAGAPASELTELLGSLPAEAEWPLKVSLVAGYEAAYPDLAESDILTQAGRDLAAELDASCVDSLGSYPDGELFHTDPLDSESWAERIEENTPGATSAPSPVLVIHSAEDANVPVEQSATLLDRLCAAGQTVERRVLPTGDHVAAAVPAYQQALEWFDALSSGAQEPTSSCDARQ